MTLPFWMYLLRKCAYRDISHTILKHTISNKLVPKVSSQKKGRGVGGVMTATNMISNFGGFRCSLPLKRESEAFIHIYYCYVEKWPKMDEHLSILSSKSLVTCLRFSSFTSSL